MRIKSKAGVSIRLQLESILRGSMPSVINTGMTNHLRMIHSPKCGRGKVVNFSFNRKEFKVTENLKVSEYTFGFYNTRALQCNDETARVEKLVRDFAITLND